ncbi:uncharacterized protein LOC103949296 isoform X1 [Pyrus x bretschneideri]|uniref:uncharacterized protein LOC103949296 isoform X1 n=1 Tax=Pyrus x bretschneideri TaxID=225117 RepID=UPI00202FC9C5|nr:uncharacterized protein LOC103949296 isoform X1 [Pyrus x bretschneideri]
MALSLVGGAAIGALFGALYDVVKISIGKTAMQYKPLLRDLKFTLDSLRPRIIQQIGEHNVELGISNEDIESLQRQMVEGTELVRMLSNRGTWSCYILCSCCNCNKPSYAEQLVELDRSLRILLEILKLQEARDVKEVLLLARKINDKQGELERRMADLLKGQQESGDGGESSGSGAETTPNEQNGENGGQQVAPSGGGVGAAALGAAFRVLFDTVMQVKDKTTVLKRPLGDLKSTLDSVKPLIEEVAECSKVLNLPNEELEDVRIQMEKGAELVSNCSKIRRWTTYKMYEYTNKLLGLDGSLQRLLTVLRGQLARDVRESLVSVSNIEAVINQIEGSGVVKLQNEAKGSCETPAAMAKSVVGLNALSVEGTRDVTETLDPEVNIKVGWQKVEESWVAQSKTEHPSRTVGQDAMNMQVGARSMEEISVSDVELGLKRIQPKEVSKLDAPFRVLGKDVLKDEEDEELDEQVEDHHDRKKKGAESVTGASGDGMVICKADGCAVDLSDAKAYNRRHRVCELHSKAPLVIVSGLKRRFCHKCSRFHDLSEFDDTKQSCRRHFPYIEHHGTATQLKDLSGDIDRVISQTERSGAVQSQNDQSEIKGSYEVVEATPPAVGLNVPSVQGTRYSKETLQTSVCREQGIHTELGLKQIQGKDVFDSEPPYAEYKETEYVPPSVTTGMDVLLRGLKRFLLNDEVSAVVLTGPGGSGKTTLAKFFCEDEEVKNIFKNNIFFVHVSENPNLSIMVQTLYQQMGFQIPALQDESIALHWLHQFLMKTALHPSMLVLDDVWPGSESLLDKFDEFKTPNYKIMVTSRYEFPAFGFPYYLKPLNAEDEMTLSHHSRAHNIELLDDEDLICVSPPPITFDDEGPITHFPDSSASYLGDGSSHVSTAFRPMDQFHDSSASTLGDKSSYVPKDAGTMFEPDNPVKSTQTYMQQKLELKVSANDKAMKKVMKAVHAIKGVHSTSWDAKNQRLTVMGLLDPALIATRLRKIASKTEVISVGPAKEEIKEDKKEKFLTKTEIKDDKKARNLTMKERMEDKKQEKKERSLTAKEKMVYFCTKKREERSRTKKREDEIEHAL